MLSNLSVKKPYVVIVFIIIIAILGVVAYLNMTVDLLPNMNLPYIAIVVVSPGSSPEEVEETICGPIEQEMATIDNVKRINSTSNEHYGMVIMEFSGNVDINSATLDIQSAMVTLESGFPDMAMDPMILKLDPSMLAVMSVAISEEGSNINDSSDYLESVGQDLLSVEGVASVSFEGLIDNLVLIMLDSEVMEESINEMIAPDRDAFVDEEAYDAAVAITPDGEPLPDRDDYVNEDAYLEAVNSSNEIALLATGMIGSMLQPELIGRALYAQNFNMPAGNVTIDGMSYLVKIGDEIRSYEDLDSMAILSIDFKQIVDNYEEIIAILENIRVSKATLDMLIGLADPDGPAKTAVDNLSKALENPEDSPYIDKIVDPLTGAVTYEVNQDIVDGLRTLGEFSDEMEEFVLPAESLAGVEFIDTLIEYLDGLSGTEELIDQLMDMREAIIRIRDLTIGGGILVEQLRVDEYGNPVLDDITHEPIYDYVFNPNLIAMVATFKDISEDLDSIVVTEQQIQDIQEMLVGLKSSFDDISAFAVSLETLLQNPTYFKKTYLQNQDGDYLDSEGNITEDPSEYVLVAYQFNNDLIETLENLPPMTFKVNDIGHSVVLNTSGNLHTLVNGTAGVILSIQKQSDISTVTVSEGVKAKLAELQKENPNLNYITLLDQGEYITYMIDTIINNLLFGALFAILVLLFFLKRIKPTLIVGSSIFISVVTAFVLMYFAGITLNIISMGGLALGVGMLVDNSIVVIENIYRKREEGASVIEACIDGAKQVSGAIISSTLTTVIIFLPIAFINGITKQLFTDIAYTITFSLAASLVVALTFVPMATSKVLNKGQAKESIMFEKMKDSYAKLMGFFLKKKWIVVATVLILFLTSIGSVFFMNRIFFPESDMGYVTLTVSIDKEKLTNDITYEDANTMIINYMNKIILEQDYVSDMGIEVTSGLAMLGLNTGGNYISANVVLVDDSERDMSAAEIVEDLLSRLEDIPGLSPDMYFMTGSSESMDLGLISDGSLSFNVYSDDLDDARATAIELAELFKSVDGVDPSSVDNGVGDAPMEYQLLIDPEKAAPYGIYIGQALQYMQGILAEPKACTTVKFDSTQYDYDVYVYGNEYQLYRWYKTFDTIGNVNKVYIDYDGKYYVKTGSDETLVEAFLTDNENELDVFTYSVDDTEYQLTGESETLTTYYSVSRINDIDLVTYELTSTVLQDTDYEYTVSVPIYKILKDESFMKDDQGNVLYRIRTDEEGEPIYLKDEVTGEYLLDDQGNIIPDYELDNEGNKIPLGIAMKEGYLSIFHEDGIRRTTVSVGLSPDANSDRVLAACQKIIDNYEALDGVKIETQGENPIITEVYQTLLIVLALGVVLIYLVMVAQFQSLKSPLIVMFTVPLAFTGSVFAMLIAGKPISVVALIGLIILMGIVVNNGIVFVDYVNQLINEGMERRKALIKTGRDRIRPILMTALTTIFALFIMAFDNSAEGSMMQPMAIATIGGMIYATMLTIFFVPIMYDLFNKKRGNIVEETHSAGVVYTASNEMKPYEQIAKYAEETPYDKSLIKNVSIKSLSRAKLMEIYSLKSEEKMKQ